MTHKDIYEKFMIEYDKANITSSYPSLTKYEVATFLDKAYLALIAQKVTGNNPRRAAFEADVKAVEDLRPLIVNAKLEKFPPKYPLKRWPHLAVNETMWRLPENYLYYVVGWTHDTNKREQNIQFTNHQIAQNFKVTDINYPWVKQPVCYMQGSMIHVLTDPENRVSDVYIDYIGKPNMFVVSNPEPEPKPTKVYKYLWEDISEECSWDYEDVFPMSTTVVEYEVINGEMVATGKEWDASTSVTIGRNESKNTIRYAGSFEFNAEGEMEYTVNIEWEVIQDAKPEPEVWLYYTEKQTANVDWDVEDHSFINIPVYKKKVVDGVPEDGPGTHVGFVDAIVVTIGRNETGEVRTITGTQNNVAWHT